VVANYGTADFHYWRGRASKRGRGKNMADEIRKPRTWDELPPVVYADGEYFSTRILERNYRKMEDALDLIANTGMGAKQCRDMAQRTLDDFKDRA
jgi:hypothetical protein